MTAPSNKQGDGDSLRATRYFSPPLHRTANAADWEQWTGRNGRRKLTSATPWWCWCQLALFISEDR